MKKYMENKIFSKAAGLVKAVLPLSLMALMPSMTGCSPDKFDGADQDGLATVDGVSIKVDVDQSSNSIQATAPNAAAGTYHVWNLPPSGADADAVDTWSTLQTVRRVYVHSGDKKIIYRIGNRNGFSQGAVEQTIHIDNALKDLASVANAIAAEKGKQWVVADTLKAHLGYGARGGDGSSKWTAGAKKVDGLVCYDDVITLYTGEQKDNFSYVGTADYTAGDDGLLQMGGFTAADTRAQADVKGASFTLMTVGDDLMLKFAAGTPMPFVPSEAFLQNPMWRIDYFSKDEIDLVANDGDNSYRLMLYRPTGSSEDELGFNGFTAGENLLADWQPEMSYWFADGGWSQIADPVHSGDLQEGFNFTMNGAGSSQWQAQVHFNKGANYATLSADKNYDFSIVIVSSADNVKATVKPQKDGDDGVFFSEAQFPLHKGVNVIALSDVPGFDGDFKIATDFAGAPEGTEFTIRNVFLTEHNAANVVPFDYSSDANVWKAVDAEQAFNMSFWWADNGWSQIANPGFSVEDKSTGAKIYTIVASDGVGGSEWQAQNAFNTTGLSVGGSELVDFSCVVICNADTRATIKLCQTDDDDNTLIYKNDIQLKAGVSQVLRFTDTQLSKGTDAPAVKLIFDLGGIPSGAEFKVTDITLMKK